MRWTESVPEREAAGSITAPCALSYIEFCAMLAGEVDTIFAPPPPPSSRLWFDLGFDELALCRLHFAVEALNPCFFIPDQADIDFITIGDIYHYYTTMDAGYVDSVPPR